MGYRPSIRKIVQKVLEENNVISPNGTPTSSNITFVKTENDKPTPTKGILVFVESTNYLYVPEEVSTNVFEYQKVEGGFTRNELDAIYALKNELHSHGNKDTLDKLQYTNSKLTYNGDALAKESDLTKYALNTHNHSGVYEPVLPNSTEVRKIGQTPEGVLTYNGVPITSSGSGSEAQVFETVEELPIPTKEGELAVVKSTDTFYYSEVDTANPPQNIIPLNLTSNSWSGGSITATLGSETAYKLFDGIYSGWQDVNGFAAPTRTNVDIIINFDTVKSFIEYKMQAPYNYSGSAPKNWTVQVSYNGGQTYEIVDTQTNITWTAPAEWKTFRLPEDIVGITNFKLAITANWGDSYTRIQNLEIKPSDNFVFTAVSGSGGTFTKETADTLYATINHTHTELNNIGKVGTKSVVETNIGTGKYLSYDGTNVVYVDAPSGSGGTTSTTKEVNNITVPASGEFSFATALTNPIIQIQKKIVVAEGNATPTMTSTGINGNVKVIGSGNYDATYQMWKCFNKTTIDGNDSWYTSTLGNWVGIDYGTTQTISKVGISSQTNGGAAYQPKSVSFQGSNDNTNWTSIHEVSDLAFTGGASVTREYTLSSPVNYRYYRMVVNSHTGSGASIGEVIFTQPASNKVRNPKEADMLDYEIANSSVKIKNGLTSAQDLKVILI